ncbi:MAG: peptidoglycan bridge formation glycyltransferase FemA/FemB family protein [Candidatus Peregrinibacteria bacterium]|nr:peptidoglycan bridge formation glycyltransferase FemA/FemB family protein [Candidatus Peregrinibacteria bacterium]
MKAKILAKSEEVIWDEFVNNHPLGGIQQSSAWARFQGVMKGRGQYWIVALTDEKTGGPKKNAPALKILGGTVVIRHKMPKGYSWFYGSRGPLLDYENLTEKEINTQVSLLLEEISKLSKLEHSIFVRFDPPIIAKTSKHASLLFKNFRKIKEGFYPQDTLVLDLEKSEEELLSEMKPKGRYNIKLAEKKGVKIEKYTANDDTPKSKKELEKAIDDFYELLGDTTQRDGFTRHPKEVYTAMVENLPQQAILYLAKFENTPVAGMIAVTYKDTATYYYGASSNEYRNTMAPYLLQWHAITEAKKEGFKWYDFMGISPENDEKHKLSGVTDFKNKFGGKRLSYITPQEHAFKKLLYLAYRLKSMVK